jgi:pimeloyl-ACP methyl ester carboxylesterase
MSTHQTYDVDVRDDRLRVMRGGAGQKLIILHGAGGADAWLPYMDHLAARFEVVVPQHPGFGGSKLPDWLETFPISPISISISSTRSIAVMRISWAFR